MTGRQMCEFIADVHFERTGEVVNPATIWNMDPRGELWPVFALYEEARAWKQNPPDRY